MTDSDKIINDLTDDPKALKYMITQLMEEKTHWAEDQKALAQSEEHYRLLVEKSEVGIFIDDRDGDFIYCNERVAEIFDMTMEDFISQSPSARILGEDYEKMAKYHKLRMEGKDAPSNYQIKAFKKGGEELFLDVNVEVLEDGGRIRGTMSYLKDVTKSVKNEDELRRARDELAKTVDERTRELEVANYALAKDLEKRKRVERALRESEDYYKRIIETLHDALLIFDPEGEIILDANQQACRMYGYSKHELIGKSLIPMTKDVEAGKNKIYITMGEGHYNNFETVHITKDKKEIFLEVNASVVDLKGKRVIVTILRDKTEQKEILSALEESEEKYRTIIDRASDGVLIIQDNIVKFANPRLAEIAGSTVDEMVGKKFTDYVHPDEVNTLADNYKRRMAGEIFDSVYKTKLKRADGSYLDAEINAGMVPFNGKPADLVFVREINDCNL